MDPAKDTNGHFDPYSRVIDSVKTADHENINK